LTENFKALVVILGLAIPTLLYLRRPLTWGAISASDYQLRMGLWIWLTIVLFVAYSFWLFVLITAVTLLTVGRKDSNPLGLYFFLLLLAPPFHSVIQGFGGINRFIDIDFLRLLSLVILLPTAARLSVAPQTAKLFRMPADKYVLGYLALLLAIQFPLTTMTDELRSFVSFFIDVFLPYYVFSRGLTDMQKVKDAFASFAGACAVMAVIALFEVFKGWLLYASLPNFLNVTWSMGGYMMREGSLRATVSTGHSIILGYVMTVALGLHLTLRSAYPSARAWRNVLMLLAAGIVASLARGPWVGALALVAVAMLLGPNAGRRGSKVVFAAILLAPLAMLTPAGPKIMSMLPFIGNADQGSVDYRQQLFDVSWEIFLLNPILGSPYYLYNPGMEQMRQGEGIIDMVNSYLGIALPTGLVGLSLFLGAFVSSVARLFHRLIADRSASEPNAVGRGLLATIVGVLVIIATASSINAVPVVYWCLAGAAAAFLRLAPSEAAVEGPRSAQSDLGARPGFAPNARRGRGQA